MSASCPVAKSSRAHVQVPVPGRPSATKAGGRHVRPPLTACWAISAGQAHMQPISCVWRASRQSRGCTRLPPCGTLVMHCVGLAGSADPRALCTFPAAQFIAVEFVPPEGAAQLGLLYCRYTVHVTLWPSEVVKLDLVLIGRLIPQVLVGPVRGRLRAKGHALACAAGRRSP